MKRAEVTFKFLTPALLAGADQKSAEIRASSIRGALRWWMNALGYDKDCINDLFGTAAGETGRRSRVVVRDTTTNSPQVTCQSAEKIIGNPNDYFLWPLGKNSRGVIPAGTTASFSVFLRSGESEDLEKGLKAFLLLGSLGSRSRRCYGSIWPDRVTIDGHAWKIPTSLSEFKTALEAVRCNSTCMLVKIVDESFIKNSPAHSYKEAIDCCSEFLKKYRCGSSRSGREPLSWGENDHNANFDAYDVDRVYRPVLGLPLVQTYSGYPRRTVRSQIPGLERLASPLHFKVVFKRLIPIMVFFGKKIPRNRMVALREKGRPDRYLPLDLALLKEMLKDPRQKLISNFTPSRSVNP